MLPKPVLAFAVLASVSLTALPASADVWTLVNDLVADPVPQPGPLPPTALTAQPSDAGNTLSWDPPLANPGAPLDGYKVYRYLDTTREYLGTVGASSTSYVDSDVDPGNHTYVYFVTASSADGESAPSNLAMPGCNNLVTDQPPYLNIECLPIVGGGRIILDPFH